MNGLDVFALFLRLNQHYRANVFPGLLLFQFRQPLQLIAAVNGVLQEFVPVGTPLHHNRELNHLFGFELLRRNAVENIRGITFHIRRGGEFNDTTRLEIRQGVKGQRCPGVVRFIDDDNRAAHGNHICQGLDRFTGIGIVFSQVRQCAGVKETH